MKKLLIFFIAMFLVVHNVGIIAAEPITVYHNKITANTGENVIINIGIKNNTGMTGMMLKIGYDSNKLKINNICNGKEFASAMFTTPDMSTDVKNPFVVSWISLDGLNGDGIIMSIDATVLNGSYNNEYGITILSCDASDIDENDIHIAVDNGLLPVVHFEDTEVKQGETVNIPILLKNNPGVSAIGVDIIYDTSIMTLNSITNSELLKDACFESGNLNANAVRLYWAGTKNSYESGILATCNFTIKENAEVGNHTMQISIIESIDINEHEVHVYGKDNILTISNSELSEVVANGVMASGVNWILYDGGILKIDGIGRMDNYSSTSNIPWYSNRLAISEVQISEGITYIGDRNFYNCISLEKVTIPNSVTSVGTYAFRNCSEMSIYAEAGTYAQTYATENSIPFVNTKKEELKNIVVDPYGNASTWCFDVSIEGYTEDAIAYAAIYDTQGKLLAITSEDFVIDDVTTLIISKSGVIGASYAKIFVWKNTLTPVAFTKILDL